MKRLLRPVPLLLVVLSLVGTGVFATAQPAGATPPVAGGIENAVGSNNVFDGGAAGDGILRYAKHIAVDSSGNLYIADQLNHRIRKVDAATGIITTVAGTGQAGSSGDGGPATSAPVNRPWGVAVDGGDNVYVSDTGGHRIRKIDVSTGVITTIAGGNGGGFSGDGGPATTAQLDGPLGVAVDATGNVYVADADNQRVRKIDTGGIITTIAGNGLYGSAGDGNPATNARLQNVYDVAPAPDGRVFLATGSNRVRYVDTDGTMQVWGGSGWTLTQTSIHVAADGEVHFTNLSGYWKIANDETHELVDPLGSRGVAVASGTTYYLQTQFRTYEGSATGPTTIFAGGPVSYGGDGGPADLARVAEPHGLDVGDDGTIWFADTENHRVRMVEAGGTITTVAGDGTPGGSGDGGPATAARLDTPKDVAVGPDGLVYVADTGNGRIRRIEANGTITTVGPDELSQPRAIAFDPDGHLVVGDIGADRIVRLEVGVGWAPLVGTGTPYAVDAPRGVSYDSTGNLYFLDGFGHRVRRLTVAGQVETLFTVELPQAIAVDRAGLVYVSSAFGGSVDRWDGKSLVRYAGSGVRGYAGDGGPALQAKIDVARGLAIGPDGDLYLSDSDNHRIRRVGATYTCDGQPVTILHWSGMTGTSGPDVILGTDGPDTIYSYGGDDLVCARGGDDDVNLGGGDDRAFGNDGDDTIRGGPDDDIIEGNHGQDDLRGGVGDDELLGGFGADWVRGQGGDDTIRGGGDDDLLLSGGAGGDRIEGGPGHDNVQGNKGHGDSLHGDAGDDRLNGGTGVDTLFGGFGRDVCHGGIDGHIDTAVGCEHVVFIP